VLAYKALADRVR